MVFWTHPNCPRMMRQVSCGQQAIQVFMSISIMPLEKMPFRYPHWKFPILSWDSNQIYAALTEFILLELDGNNSFSKIVYCAMLNQGMISGQQICELLYEHGVLEKDAGL